MLRFGFGWLSYVNDDYINYCLAAERFKDFGFWRVPTTEELAGRLVRVSRDGSSATPLATGLGLAHGVAVLPDGDYAVISGNPDFVRRVPRADFAPLPGGRSLGRARRRCVGHCVRRHMGGARCGAARSCAHRACLHRS